MYTIEDRTLGPRPSPPIPIQNVEAFSELLTRLSVSVFPIVPVRKIRRGRIPEKCEKIKTRRRWIPEKNKNTEEEEMIRTFELLNEPF